MKKKILTAALIMFLFPAFMYAQSFQWAKQVGGANYASPYEVITDLNDGVITYGYSQDIVDFDPGPGIFNLGCSSCQINTFVQKLDANGNFVWATDFAYAGLCFVSSVKTDLNSNIIITGSFHFSGTFDVDPGPGVTNLTSNSGGWTMFIFKFDPNGNFIWGKQVEGGDFSNPRDMVIAPNGDLIINGYFSGIVDFDPGVGATTLSDAGINSSNQGFVLRLDANGNFIWVKQIGGLINWFWYNKTSSTIDIDSYGNIILLGEFTDTADFDPSPAVYNLISANDTSLDGFVEKLDSNGNFLWVKQFGDSILNYMPTVNFDLSGNVLITGIFHNTHDFDPGTGVFTISSNGSNDGFIEKLDGNGNFQWAKTIGGIQSDFIGLAINDLQGDIYLIGNFQDIVDLNPGVAIDNLTSQGLRDIFIEKLDVNGNFQWVKQMGGIDEDRGYSIALDNNDNLIAIGEFNATADLNPDSAIYNLTSIGLGDIYIMKYGLPTVCNATFATVNATSCNSYTSPSGNYTWTTSGMHMDTIPNAAGCDSVLTINLTFNNSTASTQSASACNSYTSPSGNYTWTTSGVHMDTIPNNAGCDSVLTINLTINSTASTQTISACNSFISPSGNYTWSTSGTHMDTIPNAAGCDSVLTINLTINTVTASYTLYPDPDTTQLHNWFAIANVTGTAPIDYLWSWGDGATDIGATPSHTYSAAAFYAICLSVTDAAGCITTYCDSSTFISKTEEERLIITINVVTQLPNGIATVTAAANNMSVTPNPCTTCEITGAVTATDLTVTDILGRNQHATFSKSANGYYIILPEASTGIFLIRNIKTGEVVKFSKQ